MFKRILSALILIPVIVAAVFITTKIIFSIVVTILCAFGYLEFLSFPRKNTWKQIKCPTFWVSVVFGFFLIYPLFRYDKAEIVAFYFVIVAFMELLTMNKTEEAVEKIVWPLFGFIYIFYLFSFTYDIRYGLLLKNGSLILFLFLVIQWVGDTFAYFTGHYTGRHKLASKISPNKTVEGSIGGLIGSGLVGALIAILLKPGHNIAIFFVFGIFMGIVGQLGDLLESALKRYFGLKDSSNLIPGHGGMLDRLDSLLLTAPLFFFCMKIIATM